MADESQEVQTICEEILYECREMARYAFSNGLKVPADAVTFIQLYEEASGSEEIEDVSYEEFIQTLTEAHTTLSKIIHPASPQTLMLMFSEEERQAFSGKSTSFHLVRQLMISAVLFLIAFIVFRVVPFKDLLKDSFSQLKSESLQMLINDLYYLSSAGLGASFSALFRANHYLTKQTFHPKYINSYWIKYTLGLIAGITLVDLIPDNIDTSLKDITKATLAFVGGFSSDAVYRVIDRLRNTLESFITGQHPLDGSLGSNTPFSQKTASSKQLLTEYTSTTSGDAEKESAKPAG